MANPRPVGNKTPRRGRKLRRLIQLNEEAARELRLIALATKRAGDEDAIVADLIHSQSKNISERETE